MSKSKLKNKGKYFLKQNTKSLPLKESTNKCDNVESQNTCLSGDNCVLVYR